MALYTSDFACECIYVCMRVNTFVCVCVFSVSTSYQ